MDNPTDDSSKFITDRMELFILRAKKLQSLFEGLSLDVTNMPVRFDNYFHEIQSSWIFYMPLSTIFSCAALIEQIYISEYIRDASNVQEKTARIKQVTGEIKSFGKIISRCKAKKVRILEEYHELAEWLDGIRNAVAVHPTYISKTYPEGANKEDSEIYFGLLQSEIKELLRTLHQSDDEKIIDTLEKSTFANVDIGELKNGKRHWTPCSLTRILEEKLPVSYSIIEQKMYSDVYEQLAFKSIEKTLFIINDLARSQKK